MGILQEYKFFLIIAIIALVGIIALFFNTQKSQEYVDFTTNLQASYAQIKGTASDAKTVKDVVTIDGTNIKGLKNNSLFGLTLDGAASTVLFIDDLDTSDVADVNTAVGAAPAAGKFKVALATTSSATAGTVGDMDAVAISTLTASMDSVDKGWDLDTNGYVLYTFESANVARDIIDSYLPEGSLV